MFEISPSHHLFYLWYGYQEHQYPLLKDQILQNIKSIWLLHLVPYFEAINYTFHYSAICLLNLLLDFGFIFLTRNVKKLFRKCHQFHF